MDDELRRFPVVLRIPVVWGYMDALQHVNNVAYLRYFESARIADFDKLGGLSLMYEKGIGPILRCTQCRFKKLIKYPDQILSGVKVTRVGDGKDIFMKHAVASEDLKAIAAEGESRLVFFDFNRKIKLPVPAEIREIILFLEKDNIDGHVIK